MKQCVYAVFLSVCVLLVGCDPGPPVTYLDDEQLHDDVGPVDQSVDPKFQTTSSGLKYRILRQANGAKPNATDTVTVHYRGWLDNGSEFDSSYKRGAPATFGLSGVVKGWTEGLQLVGTGGMIELWVPSDLGYGATGGAGGKIGPNATLHFVVELISIKEAELWTLPTQ